VHEALDTFGLGALGERFPHELSSGQGQLFRLALTWFRPARLLLLDEPEQRLDTDRRRMVGELVLGRRAAGTTVLMACHDPALTATVADVVVDVGPPA
jgi:ABC-type sulfate/molybdate transport systems ATPase subunit